MPHLQDYLYQIYPQTRNRFSITRLCETELDMSLHVTEDDIRPGGTLSGPSMFTLADCAFYALVLSQIGKKALAVTNGVHIQFLRKPEPIDLTCTARMLKKGRSLCMGDAMIYAQGILVAHANVSYALPGSSSAFTP